MEVFNFIYGVEEDKNLRPIWTLIKFLKDSAYDELMHFSFSLHDFIIVFDALKGDSFSQLLLNHFVYIEFYHIFGMFFVKVQELFFHGSWTSDDIRTVSFSYLQDLGQSLLLLLEDVVYFVYGYEFTVVKFQISPLTPIQKGFWHTHDDVSELMSLFIKTTYLEF